MGVEVLDNAFKGYNACLFAYGQTGSGKSFSIVGTDSNTGILPRVCESIFLRQEESKKQNVNQRLDVTVKVGMIEIYNEKVYDLYIDPSKRTKEGYKIREDPKKGIYVEGQKTTEVTSYKHLQKEIDRCTEHRTIGATNMNATSSRAHTITMLSITQIFYDDKNQPKNRYDPTVNIIDLAGSERSEKTGATGDRLQEGCNINKGLMVLGRVISLLAEHAIGKNKKDPVPYRDSNLTRILQTALGGNSKTSMIAAISPAADNYDETMSTLRYADQVKKIKNTATINETAQDKLIRELREENLKLKRMLEGVQSDGKGIGNNPQEEEIKRQMEEQQEKMKELEQTYEQRLAEAMTKKQEAVEDSTVNSLHLANLNEDDQLNRKLKHPLSLGSNMIGKPNKERKPQVPISGLGIVKDHCEIVVSDAGIYLVANEDPTKTRVFVNGKLITSQDKVELHHEDRLLFGNYNYFILIDPTKPVNSDMSWDLAMKEVNGDQIKSLAEDEDAKKKRLEVEAKIKEENEASMLKMQEQLQKMKEEKDKLEEDMQDKLKKANEANMSEEELNKLKEELRKEMTENNKKFQDEEIAIKKTTDEEIKKNERKKNEQEMKQKSMKDVEDKLAQVIPKTTEINEICLQMGRLNYKYETMLNTETTKEGYKISKVCVKVFPNVNEEFYNVMSFDEFMDKYYKIKEKFEDHEESLANNGKIEAENLDEDADTFGVMVKNDWVLIGQAFIYLEALANLIDIKNDSTPLIDTKGVKNGELKYSVTPKYYENKREQNLIDFNNVDDLESKKIKVLLQIFSLRGLPSKYSSSVYCKYNWIDENAASFETGKTVVRSQNPDINYEKDHDLFLSRYVIDHMYESSLAINVYGKMSDEHIEAVKDKIRNMNEQNKANIDSPEKQKDQANQPSQKLNENMTTEERIRALMEENEQYSYQ